MYKEPIAQYKETNNDLKKLKVGFLDLETSISPKDHDFSSEIIAKVMSKLSIKEIEMKYLKDNIS